MTITREKINEIVKNIQYIYDNNRAIEEFFLKDIILSCFDTVLKQLKQSSQLRMENITSQFAETILSHYLNEDNEGLTNLVMLDFNFNVTEEMLDDAEIYQEEQIEYLESIYGSKLQYLLEDEISDFNFDDLKIDVSTKVSKLEKWFREWKKDKK